MGKYFGTDGFRGEANKALTAQKAFKVGRYIGWYYGQQHDDGRARIIIGKDTRRSSYMLEAALTAGITSSGSDAYLLHVTTTPSVSFCCRTDGFDCGIMISASHNPFYDNGIKIMRANGQKIEAEIEEKIEAYIDGEVEEIPLAEREAIGNVIDYASGRNRYIGYLMTIPTRAFNGMKVGLDCANGASWNIARSVFEALGAKVYIINNQPDGLNINTNCGSTHIDTLKKYVLENGLNVGFAYDGDADRCLAVDELGNEVNGDQIMFLCGKYLKESGKLDGNTIVTTIMSNMGLYKACEAIGIRTEKTNVGDKYVAENMMANGFVLGGEQSGHIIFAKYATTGDGILTSLMVLMTMLEKKLPLSMLAGEMKMYPQCLKNVVVKDKEAAQKNPAVLKGVEEVNKALAGDGRMLLRASGTEPKIRVMVEAKTDEICEKYVDQLIEVIKEQGLTAD
ncbi:MAG: phosphoglucosamine mutase [Eubacteriales bacterium]|nr:phosphoglucosamine mutase [Clostridiales bacterium]MBR2599223.1 phosphoglucosamine mutase [Clostridiales bacterium]MDO4420560.1 phosphoglucosamine mutase [Eubacteriales bacterium]